MGSSVADIPDDFIPRSLGSRNDGVRRIREVLPTADFSESSWGSFEGPDFSIEFNLGDDEDVGAFALHVRGGDAAAALVADLLVRCGWRAFDPASAAGIFDPANAADGLRKWRALRNRAVASDDD